jgi:hypothetical protein
MPMHPRVGLHEDDAVRSPEMLDLSPSAPTEVQHAALGTFSEPSPMLFEDHPLDGTDHTVIGCGDRCR